MVPRLLRGWHVDPIRVGASVQAITPRLRQATRHLGGSARGGPDFGPHSGCFWVARRYECIRLTGRVLGSGIGPGRSTVNSVGPPISAHLNKLPTTTLPSLPLLHAVLSKAVERPSERLDPLVGQ